MHQSGNFKTVKARKEVRGPNGGKHMLMALDCGHKVKVQRWRGKTKFMRCEKCELGLIQ